MGPINNQAWRNPFHRPSAAPSKLPPPDEFVCPISGNLMLDPVNVSSGHTFERTSVQICKDLAFIPTLPDGSIPDFSGSLPQPSHSLQNWFQQNAHDPPTVDYYALEETVRSRMAESDLLDRVPSNPPVENHVVTLPHIRKNSDQFGSGTSSATPVMPLNFKTKPASYSSSPTAEVAPGPFRNPKNLDQRDAEDEDDDRLLMALVSSDVAEQEEGVLSLRNLTRTDDAGARRGRSLQLIAGRR